MKINVFGVIIWKKKRTKKSISFNWVRFIKVSNLHVDLYNNMCPTQKIPPLQHLEKSIVICFYDVHKLYGCLTYLWNETLTLPFLS
jgi:hypothetical protein